MEASWRRDGGEMEAATRVAATSGESGEAVATHPNPNPNQSAGAAALAAAPIQSIQHSK